jgi:acetyltransferase-like isoleucine patch superfamily enzyme
MTETPVQQFQRVGGHVFREAFKKGLRTCVLVRPLVNLWLALRTRSIIHPLASIDWNVKIGRRCFIGCARLDTLGGNGRIEIGDGSIVYSGCDLLCHHNSSLRLGKNVLFTRQAGAVTGGHVFSDPAATIISQGIATADIVVEDDCWIGYRAILLPGVHVGHGTVVAAGAVVAKDLPPMVVAGGVPAKVIRPR